MKICRQIRITGAIIGLLVGSLWITGCGGAASSPSSFTQRGVASFTVQWPKRGPEIPTSSNSLSVSLSLKGQAVQGKVIPRPASGQTQTTTTFTNLPISTLDVKVSAYPSTDGTGVAQAVGSGSLVVSASQMNTVTISLASTVATLSATPASIALIKGAVQTVSVSATDASGNLVLLSSRAASEPITWTSSVPTVVSVTGSTDSASVQALSVGSGFLTASMKVTDSGKTVTATIPFSVTSAGAGLQSGSPWPKSHAGSLNTGQGLGVVGNGVPQWTVKINGGAGSAPAVAADGSIYFGSGDHNVYKVDSLGNVRWTFLTGGMVSSSPAIGADGTIYVCSADNNLYAISPAGSKVWAFPAVNVGASDPAIGRDGTIYVTSSSAPPWLYAVNGSNGVLKWKLQTALPLSGSVAISPSGTIYAGCQDDSIYAINPDDGSIKWNFPLSGFPPRYTYGQPSIGANGNVYTGSGGNLYAIDGNTGAVVWKFTSPASNGQLLTCPGVAANGTVYAASAGADSSLYAVDGSTGRLKWSYVTWGGAYGIQNSPAIGSDGTVYLTAASGIVFALSHTTGLELWRCSTNDTVQIFLGPPSLGADGTLYFSQTGGGFWAIK